MFKDEQSTGLVLCYAQSPSKADPGPGWENDIQINDCNSVEYSVISTLIEAYTSQDRNSKGGSD